MMRELGSCGSWMVKNVEASEACWAWSFGDVGVVSHRSTWGWWSVAWSLQRCGWWRCLALWHPAVAQGEAKDAAALRAWRSLSYLVLGGRFFLCIVGSGRKIYRWIYRNYYNMHILFWSFPFQSCKMEKHFICTSVSWIQSVARPKIQRLNDQSSRHGHGLTFWEISDARSGSTRTWHPRWPSQCRSSRIRDWKWTWILHFNVTI